MMSVKSSGDLPAEVGMEFQPLRPLPGVIKSLCVFVCVVGRGGVVLTGSWGGRAFAVRRNYTGCRLGDRASRDRLSSQKLEIGVLAARFVLSLAHHKSNKDFTCELRVVMLEPDFPGLNPSSASQQLGDSGAAILLYERETPISSLRHFFLSFQFHRAHSNPSNFERPAEQAVPSTIAAETSSSQVHGGPAAVTAGPTTAEKQHPK